MDFLINAWRTYPIILDLLLYLLVFGAAARVAFLKTFPGYEGRLLAGAVGIFMAAALAMAQAKMGFSTENLGPVAALILCGVVFLATYKFIQQSAVPKHTAILLSILIAFALLRAAMPRATSDFIRRNPLLIILAIAGLLYWAWHASERLAQKLSSQRPGNLLSRYHAIPDKQTLSKENRLVRRRMEQTTKSNLASEKTVANSLTRAAELLQKEGVTKENRGKILGIVDGALQRSNQVNERCARLGTLDTKLLHFDMKWFRQSHGINFGQLTPAQQKVMHESLLEERKRLRAEEELDKLQQEAKSHLQAMEDHISKSRQALFAWNTPAALGWLNEAIKEEQAAEQIEKRAIDWERRMIHLLKRQKHTLASS